MGNPVSTIRPVSKLRKLIRFIFKLLKWLFLLMIIGIILLGCLIFYEVKPTLQKFWNDANILVDESTENTFKLDETSYIYANDGSCITKLVRDADCEYVKFEELPQGVVNAFIAIEDKRFYIHKGVDWLSTAKAFVQYALYGDSSRGGSTITQQLARNVFSDIGFSKNYERKIKEIFTALCLERKYEKTQILEFYINNINYSNGYYGIGAAAHGYFNKKVSKLTDAEVALLCAIPNNPTYYNPHKYIKHTLHRRNLILTEMVAQKYLTEKEYLAAVNSAIKLKKQRDIFYNYESSYAIFCTVEHLMSLSGFRFQYSFKDMDDFYTYRAEYEDAFAFSRSKLFSHGYRVYTSIDLVVQRAVQECGDQELSKFNSVDANGIFNTQFGATVIDNSTGKVIAISGGRSQRKLKSVYSLNRAYQSYKQPGSCIKPLVVYTPSLENGYTPDTVVYDVYDLSGPKNSDDTYLGDITLRTAVEKSKNTVAWGLMRILTPQAGLRCLQNMHFDKITPNDYYLSAALGGLYSGVTTVQMSSGYAALYNLGEYRNATCITSIKSSNGKEIYHEPKEKQVYKSEAASSMVDILSGVPLRGTAAGLCLPNNEKMPIACKTGTTDDQRCGWFCGFTPYYTCAVYVGNDNNEPISDLYGATYPMYIWRDIQDFLCKGKKYRNFKQVDSSSSKKRSKTERIKEGDKVDADATTNLSGLDGNDTENQSNEQSIVQDQQTTVQIDNDATQSYQPVQPDQGQPAQSEQTGQSNQAEQPNQSNQPEQGNSADNSANTSSDTGSDTVSDTDSVDINGAIDTGSNSNNDNNQLEQDDTDVAQNGEQNEGQDGNTNEGSNNLVEPGSNTIADGEESPVSPDIIVSPEQADN